MQLKRNWTQRYHWYPKPLAIRQQKTRLVPETPAGYPPPTLLPLSGGSKWPPAFLHHGSFLKDPRDCHAGVRTGSQ